MSDWVSVNAPEAQPAAAGFPKETSDENVARSRRAVEVMQKELAQAKTDDEALDIGKEIDNAKAAGNRGSRIATEMKGGEWKSVNAGTVTAKDDAGWVSVNQETKKPEPKSDRGEFMKGLIGGMVSANPKMFGAAVKGAGTMAGWDWLKAQGDKLASFGEEKAKDYQPAVGSIANVRTDGVTTALGDFFTKYLPYQTGNALASMAPSIASGLAGAAGGSVVGGPPGAAVGGFAGVVLTGYPMNYGDIYSDALDDKGIKQAIKDGKLTDQDVAKITALAAVPITALDSWSLGKLGSALTKDVKASLYKRIFSEMSAGGLREGTTEGLQQIISEAVQHLIGSDKTAKDHAIAVVDNAIGGLMGGAVIGGGAGAVQGAKPATPPQENPAQAPSAGAPEAGPTAGATAASGADTLSPTFADQFMAKPPQELSTLAQARVDGQQLKETGSLPVDVLKDTTRFENARLIEAYGENNAVAKVIEHPELTGNLKQAMLEAAPTVERVRAKLAANEQSRDITSDIVSAVDELAAIKASSKTLDEAMLGMSASYEARQLVKFLHDNVDKPQRVSQFLESYMGVVESMGGVPSEVRGRAFDIIQERNVARQHQQNEEGRQLLAKMEQKQTEDAAYAERETASKKRDAEIARLKDEDRKRTQTAVKTDRAEKIAAELRAKAVAKKPEEKTAMSLAMEKAKGSNREKPSAADTGRAEQIIREQNKGAPAQATVAPVPGAPEIGHAGEPQSVREGGAEKGAASGSQSENVGDGTRESPVQAAAPEHVAVAAERAAELPTPAQIEAGVNKKGRFQFAEGHPLRGLGVISIETAKGTPRVHAKGEWSSPPMPAHYGHLAAAEGADGDKADVTIGDHLDAKRAYLIDQIRPYTGRFDEVKSFIGFESEKAAVKAYLGSFSDDAKARIGAVTEMPVEQFVQRARADNLKKPVAYKEPEKATAPAQEEAKPEPVKAAQPAPAEAEVSAKETPAPKVEEPPSEVSAQKEPTQQENLFGGENPAFHRAFHGSPHDFDRFSLQHIGKGEGAQSYGWGLYFSGRKSVAEWYRNKLAGQSREHRIWQVERDAARRMVELNREQVRKWSSEDGRKIYREQVAKTPHLKADEAFVDAAMKRLVANSEEGVRNAETRLQEVLAREPKDAQRGRLYEVELAPKEDDYLDWGKPYSQQSEKVKQALSKIFREPSQSPLTKIFWKVMGEEKRGSQLYSTLADALGGQKEGYPKGVTGPNFEGASKALLAAGIPGIKYLDAGSRTHGEGSHNYVIFDDSHVNVEAKFHRGAEQSGLSNADISRAVAPILAKWKNAPEVLTIDSMAEAPQAVKLTYMRQQEGGAMGEPEAFIYRNKVYLVAEGLASPEAATRALLHESVGHFGLRQTFGERLDPILDEVAKSLPFRMKAKAREYGLNLGDASERRQVAEEVLAEMAQTMPHLGVVKKLIAAIRQFLRDIGVHLKLSDNDVIANFILPARGFVERGEFTKMVESPAFSRMTQAIDAARQKNYKALATNFVDRLDQALNPLGTLPEQEQYLIRRYEAQGTIEKADEAAKAIRGALPTASAADQAAIFDYLTTAGSNSSSIVDPVTRHSAEQIKADINRVGDELVSHGLLSEESREQYRDAYLPRLYLKHLLSEGDWKALGAGKKPSDMGYLKGRKDIPEDVRKVILGEVRDPGFLAAVAVAKPMRDMALLDWLSDISQNEKWILPGAMVDFTSPLTGRSQKATPFYLKNEAARLRKQARFYAPDEAAKAEREAKAMDQAADDALEGVQGTHENYKQIPNTARYGRLRGLLVRSEIYDDLMGVQDFLPTDPGWFQNVFGYGGVGTKATGIWKAMKVSMNPPAQIRNFVSNGVLIQLSGVPLRLVPARVIQATRDVLDNGKYSQIAKKYGVGVSTFATQEVHRMKTELLDLEMKTRGMGPLGRLHRLAALTMNKAGDFYQMSETIFKTAKIIDAMEREGMSEQKAVLEANKWLFDYSLVQKSLRYARSAPIGVPFATFSMKVLPRLVEVAMHHPQRFLPWVGLFYGFPMLVASMLGVDKDDLDKLKKALPQRLQDKGHALILPYKDEQGRWQVVDLGYFMPWTSWTELAGNVAAGELGKAIQGAGIFGGPLTDIITAVKTGKDPFTGRDILAKGDPPERQAVALLNYVWNMAMPPIVTDRGLVSPMGLLDKAYGGKLEQALSGTTNKFGEPRATATQALLYSVGVNMNAMTPEYTRATNLQAMQRDMQDVKRQMVQKLYDRSLTDEQRRDIAKEYATELVRRTDKMTKYMRESAIAPALAAQH